jgi:hypothetical protein
MSRKKRIGYLTWGTPWNNSEARSFYHHDAVLRRLDATIVVVVPPLGAESMRRALLGDRSHLLKGLQGLDLEFSGDLNIRDLDAIIIEPFIFRDLYKIPSGRLLGAVEIERFIGEVVQKFYREGKPILWYDSEGYFTDVEINLGSPIPDWKMGRRLLENVIDLSECNQALISPMKFHTAFSKFRNSAYVPFNIDPNEPVNERPKSSRNYLMTYIGNTYDRSHITSRFYQLSELGKVKVIGNGWKFAEGCDILNCGPRLLDLPEIVSQYSGSLLGLFCSPHALRHLGHRTLRIRELVASGLFTIPEAHLAEEVTGGLHLYDPLVLEYIYDLMKWDDEKYREEVKIQRERVMDHYNVDLYVGKYKEFLGL